MSDTYKIKAMLDTSDVKRGAREIEQELSTAGKTLPAPGGGGLSTTESKNQIDEHNKATYALQNRNTATEKLIETQRKLSTEQKTSIIMGGGVMAAALGGAALKAGGMDTAAGALTGAAQGAAQLGTMLAPLGPQAALIGAAAGGITGALTSLVGSFGTARKALAEEAAKAKADADALRVQAARNRADEIVSRRQFEELAKTDPEAAKSFLEGIRKELSIAMVSAQEGAPIEQDLKKAALYYPEETSDVIRTGDDKGALTREQKDLGLAINFDKYMEDMKKKTSREFESSSLKTTGYGLGGMQIETTPTPLRDKLASDTERLTDLFPELMNREGKKAFTPRAEIFEKNIPSERLSSSKSSTGSGSVDAFQALGLGIYSNPMRRSEQLLQSIDGRLAILTRRPQTGVLL